MISPGVGVSVGGAGVDLDITQPTAGSLSLVVDSSTQITVSHTGASDNVGIDHIVLEWSPNGTSSWTTLSSDTSFPYVHSGLTASTAYYYRATVYDAAGNNSTTATVNDTTSAPAGGTVYFTEDFETALPAAYNSDGTLALNVNGGWDGNDCATFTLPAIVADNDYALPDWAVFAANQSRHVFIGFAEYYGANWASAIPSTGTCKPLIVHPFVGGNAKRMIHHLRLIDTGAGTPVDVGIMYPEHGQTRSANDVICDVTEALTTDVNTTTNAITENNHLRQTGDRYYYTNAGGQPNAIGGLTVDRYYNVIRVDANTFQLAENFDDAIAGTNINLTSVGTGTHTFTFNDLFVPAGNLSKWFWHEIELDMDAKVVRWWLTARDNQINVLQPIPNNGNFLNGGGVPTYATVSCTRRLIVEKQMEDPALPGSYDPGDYWLNADYGFYGNWTGQPTKEIDTWITADNATDVAAPVGFQV